MLDITQKTMRTSMGDMIKELETSKGEGFLSFV